MIVQSFGQVQALTTPSPSWRMGGSGGGSLNLYGASQQTYAHIYRTQPNVRTVVDFLARNIAQLGLKVYRRVSDTDRQPLPDHELAGWLTKPNPATSRYRLFEALVQDLGIYFNAYWLKVRSAPLGLLRLPPAQMSVTGTLMPMSFTWTLPNGATKDFDPSEIVYFNGSSGFDPNTPAMGLSPLETLRRILAEEASAGAYRESLWRNAGRMEGIWEIAKDTPAAKWTKEQQQSWREQWQEFSGGGSKAGMTALGPVGGTYKSTSFSARDNEFVLARKLTREECAAAYHVPLPMVGILDHATFSNIVEQHKNLYQDCLGPWLVMIEEEIERQLLIECEDQTNVYTEFNIAEKMKGSFEEQATSLHTLVGRPIMTANEGRARLNLPSITDDPTADQLAAQQGGPADASVNPASDTTPPADAKPATAVDVAPVIEATRDRQMAKLAKLPVTDRPAAFTADLDRWTRELAADLHEQTGEDETARAERLNADLLARLENDARDGRLTALEQRPLVPHVEIHEAPITIHNPAGSAGKAITFKRDGTGAVVGAEVAEVV